MISFGSKPEMAINIVNSAQRQNAKSHLILVVTTAIAAALLFSSTTVSGLFTGSGVSIDVDDYAAFAQEQNQTGTAAAIGNNTNTTIAAASAYNEMLNPRQTEYPAHLGFNDYILKQFAI
jgi:hypothetical protein